MIAGSMVLMIYLSTSAQEMRFGVGYEKNILPKLEIDGKVQLRKRINQSKAYYSIVQAGLAYDISENITVSGSFRYSTAPGGFDEEINDDINEKMRYTANFILGTKRFNNDIKIRNRLRYQHSVVISDDDRDYIRNKLIIDYKLTKRMKPYVAVEPYLLLEEQRLRKLRFYLGSEFELFSNELELCFIVEGKSKDGTISMFHAAGIHYTF